MSVFTALIVRDVRRAWSHGGASLPIAFLLLVAILFPFVIGPDRVLLAQVGGGVIWAAALPAAPLPVERIVAPDADSGVLVPLPVRGMSLPPVAAEIGRAAGRGRGCRAVSILGVDVSRY